MSYAARQRLILGVAALTVSTGALAGCKNFLSDAAIPQGTLDQGTLSTKVGVEGTLIAAYRQLDWTSGVGAGFATGPSNWVWGSITSDDAYKGTEATDGPEFDALSFYQWGAPSVEGPLNDKWRSVYEGVVRSNAAITLLKKVVAEKPSEISAADAKSIEGEATFLRAHYHFEAWRIWGNIPYYRETDTDFNKPQLAKADVPAEIIKDLDAAIALLPATPRNGEKARVTSWTAKAYKGRVQMYAGQFAAALTTLRDVRQNGPYALEASYDRVWTGFSQFENGKETIFAYNASANDGEPSGNNANYGARLTFPHSGSPFGCCGFHQPSQNLVNFFQVDANGLPLSQSNPTGWNTNNANFAAGSPQAVDPRLDFTVGRDGVPYKDWGPHTRDWIRAPAYGGTYSPKKNVHEKASGAVSLVGWNNTQLNSVNIHIFRYADLLLMLAEAEVEQGSLETARTIVNEIRARAAVRVQGPGTDAATIAVPITDSRVAAYANYRIGLYTSPWTSQTVARNAVRDERRLELAMEGQRFFDLRRWGIADQVLNAYVNVEKTRRVQYASAAAYASRNDLFPIPPIQIQLSQGKLKQNPGW